VRVDKAKLGVEEGWTSVHAEEFVERDAYLVARNIGPVT
jgi:hypothetical protein